jgi:hypothetical protein
MFDPEKTYNDEAICLNQGLLYRKGKTDKTLAAFSLFPNPAGESITLRYEIAEEQKSNVVIRNSIGQRVYFSILSSGEKEMEIKTHTLNNGIYTVQLFSGDMLLHQEKLVIIR